jgi:DtxR family transcriptional regulator, Mn-dependent transcriptional regulator
LIAPNDSSRAKAGTGNDAPTPVITPAMEDYLKRIYRLEGAGTEVATQRLADELGFSGASVTNMVKRLHELRLVEHTPYHGVRLTPAGERVALEVIRHHRLLELYLAETLGYGWDQVHEEAERLEHHVSDELEARMDSILGYPTRQVANVSSLRLVDLEPGIAATVVRVSDRDPEQLRFLGNLGLRPGAQVTLLERLPFSGPIRVSVDGVEHVIGEPLATSVNVLPGTAPPAKGA